MKIGINGLNLSQNFLGVNRYLKNIIREWIINNIDHELIIYTPNNSNKLNKFISSCNTNKIKIKTPNIPKIFGASSLWYSLILPIQLIKNKIDFFFSGDYFMPLGIAKKMKTSMTIHDVSYIFNSESLNFIEKIWYKFFSINRSSKANIIFTDSVFSKNEILKYFQINPKNIKVVPCAVEEKFRPIKSSSNIVNNSYFLFIGLIINRRHVDKMLYAFKNFCLSSNSNIKFYIRGDNHTRPYIDIDKIIKNINNELKREAIVNLPYLSDKKLIKLYQNALAFFYLSEYEGFGLPVLEAMACGIPTVTVNSSSISEVAGNAGIYVNPNNINEISSVMTKITTNKQWLEEIKRKSIHQSSNFSWKNTAEITLNEIENLYK